MSDNLHPKLQLSAEDVRYLKKVFFSDADAKINLHMPGDANASESDPMKERVQQLVQEFIDGSFELARHSMIVDGVDMTERRSLKAELDIPREDIEPFDHALNDKLKELYDQVEQGTLEVTGLRRRVPLEADKLYSELLGNQQLDLNETFDMDSSLVENALQQDLEHKTPENANKDRIQSEFISLLHQVDTVKEKLVIANEDLDRVNSVVKFISSAKT